MRRSTVRFCQVALKVSFSLVLSDLSASGEMVDAQDLGSCVLRHVGSSPISRTKNKDQMLLASGPFFLLNGKLEKIFTLSLKLHSKSVSLSVFKYTTRCVRFKVCPINSRFRTPQSPRTLKLAHPLFGVIVIYFDNSVTIRVICSST